MKQKTKFKNFGNIGLSAHGRPIYWYWDFPESL